MKRKKAIRPVRRAVQAMGLPEDVMLGLPRILMRGDSTLLLENHHGVVEYGPERLRVRTALGMLTITGRELVLSALGDEDMMITGVIRAVEIAEGGGKAGLV